MTTRDNYKTPRDWAILAVYSALDGWRRGLREVEIANQIYFALRRLYSDETGESFHHDDPYNFIHYFMNPEMGAGLGDMGEWAEWIVDTAVPLKGGAMNSCLS